MLVITRQVGDTIIINDTIEVKILSSGNQIRLGISAPPEVNVVRGEPVQDTDVSASG